MRRFAIFALALALGAPACDDDSPTGPSTSGPIVFTAELAGLERGSGHQQCRVERPGNGHHHVQRPARRVGQCHRRRHVDRAGRRQQLHRHERDQASHIHNGAAGVNAGVFVDTLLTPANAIPLPGGAGDINFEQVQITQSQAQAVMDNPAGNYFNMHTPAQSAAEPFAGSWSGCR